MARTATKEKSLTPEDKLVQALVPDVEQPYRVPENWCWTRVKHLCSLKNGRAFKPSDWSKTGLPIIRIQNLNDPDNEYNYFDGKVSDDNRLFGGELLFAWSGTPGTSFGAHIWHGKDAVLNQHIFRVDFDENNIDKKFFMYAINQQLDLLISSAHGGAGLQHVTKGVFEATPIAFPPLAEQQRIVDRIESLFAKLDEAKEKAQAVMDSFEDRKAAILLKAFTGELTAGWRKKNGIAKENWESVQLEDVCTVNPSKVNTKDLPDDLEVSFFPMPALSEVYGTITEPQTRKLSEVRTGFTNFSEGDVVFAKITPCMENGKSAVIGPLINNIGFGTTEFFVLRCGEKLYNRYLWHLVRSSAFRSEAKAVMSGAVGQQRVPKSFLENYQLSLPPVEEQIEVVHVLDEMFVKEQRTTETAKQVIDQIDTMKKSILSRAFRGELGTNDPTDESAVELLKRVLEDNTNDEHAKPNKKRTIIPKSLEQQLSNGLERDLVLFMLKANTDSVSMKDLMSISSKKFELMDTIRKLEKKGILKKDDSGQYCLGAQEK